MDKKIILDKAKRRFKYWDRKDKAILDFVFKECIVQSENKTEVKLK